jgi:hypothetical protein
MSIKVYTSSRGKVIDMGALRLRNEQVRAVGNMGVNARGDRIDSQGNVIDPRNQQLERRIQRQTNVQEPPVPTKTTTPKEPVVNLAEFPDLPEDEQFFEPPTPAAPVTPIIEPDPIPVAAPAPVEPIVAQPKEVVDDPNGGLAAAIARAKTVKQELEQTAREKQKSKPLRKI